MDEHRQTTHTSRSLPCHARLPINHCNLPAIILGSLTFQQHPIPLHLDGVEEFHAELFSSLEAIKDSHERAVNFQDYMRSAFLLDHLDEAGFNPKGRRRRDKADYLRMLRGWLFDPDGKEGAVLKSWVESRFGLRALNHHGPLKDTMSEQYLNYQIACARGLYNTNALEAQLDLLYTYCQYEISRKHSSQGHIRLYRGINRIDEHEVLHRPNKHDYILVLNNLNSFTSNRERADEFGDYIMEANIPLAKLLYVPSLLPGSLRGEEEYLVLGGIYQVKLSVF
ncbi:MAG: NAD(+)--dinitrogen-reductase ADP-D-ribosyltransferase [Candidatus Thiodiazotropha endolucinida]|nr:NAD(+)--dinitrogen-reductase ADP-D-ribosyltransferase [Candidatus Thiodiazotropha endolucinida]